MALAASSSNRKKLLSGLKSNNNSSNGFKTPKRFISSSLSTNLNKTKTYLNGASSKFTSLNKNFITDQTNKTSKRFNLDETRKFKNESNESIENDFKHEILVHRQPEAIEIELNKLTNEELKAKEKFFDEKLKDLKEKLEKLKQVGLCNNGKQLLNETSESSYLNEYLNELERLDGECEDKLDGLNEWYRREKEEIEETFKLENKKAIQEFHDKRKELKDSLTNEYDEMIKQIEIDRNTLDINMDVTEIKPPPTRNLRRRANHNNLDSSIDASSHDVNTSLLHVSTSVSSSSGLLQSSAVLVGSTTSLTSSNLICSSQTTYYASSNSLSQTVNDRKRKLTPATLAFQLNDDDLNDDLKYLNKSLRVSQSQSPTKS